MTKVKFLIEKPEGNLPCNVFAYFPEMKHNNIDIGMFTSYAHIGQHSACHWQYADECKEAKYNQYQDLLKELIGQGYNDLIVLNYQPIVVHRPPTKSEIKFGYGATHYKDYNLSAILNKMGNIKKWFIALDDGLRYYTT